MSRMARDRHFFRFSLPLAGSHCCQGRGISRVGRGRGGGLDELSLVPGNSPSPLRGGRGGGLGELSLPPCRGTDTSPRARVPSAAFRMGSLRSRQGMTFIEVLIAVALLGVIVVTMMAGLSSIALATGHHRQQTTLDLLVRSEAEFLKSQAYIPKPPPAGSYQNLSAAGYTFSAPSVLYWDPAVGTFSLANNENGLQQISVTVTAPGGGSEQIIVLKVQP
ncbi:MAG: prepilin-type N-terminal cleavage/methylation domain-containing protein [Chloroflexi bacterium]|nr:MAG: prepilin-type N-terminal cleavage/methylation domain-containing protein [Chloroflexota bacterium]